MEQYSGLDDKLIVFYTLAIMSSCDVIFAGHCHDRSPQTPAFDHLRNYSTIAHLTLTYVVFFLR